MRQKSPPFCPRATQNLLSVQKMDFFESLSYDGGGMGWFEANMVGFL